MHQELIIEPTARVSDRLYFFDSGNERIMWVDYSKSSPEAMISLLEKASDFGKESGEKLNILANFKSTPQSAKFNKKLKEHGKLYYKSGIKVKVAVLGIDSSLKRVVVNATMVITRIKNVKLFESKQDAIKWLTV